MLPGSVPANPLFFKLMAVTYPVGASQVMPGQAL